MRPPPHLPEGRLLKSLSVCDSLSPPYGGGVGERLFYSHSIVAGGFEEMS